MAKGDNLFCDQKDKFTEKASKPASFLVFFMMLITSTEVIARYVFNHPTTWAWPLNRQIFGVFILVAGAYAMSKREHIRIEILYDHFPQKSKYSQEGLPWQVLSFLWACWSGKDPGWV